MKHTAGSQAQYHLQLLTTALDDILTAATPEEALRAAAAALCQWLPAAGGLWVLAHSTGAECVTYGEAGPLLRDTSALRALPGAALRRALLVPTLLPQPEAKEPLLRLTLRLHSGTVAVLWLRTADTPKARALCQQPAQLALDRAELLRSHSAAQPWDQMFEELPAALALFSADGALQLVNRQLRGLLEAAATNGEARPSDVTAHIRQRLEPLHITQRLTEVLASGSAAVVDELPVGGGRALVGVLTPLFASSAPSVLTDPGDDVEADHAADPPVPARGRPLGAVLLLRDATDEHRLHRRLLIGERMAAVGQLAAGLAHEISNPISIVYADLQLARDLLSHQGGLPTALSELPEMVDECLVGIGRVRDIVRDLRTFTSAEVRSQPGEARLDDIIDQALRLARTEVLRRARLVYDRDMQPLPTVRGDAGRLGQVVLNLLSQAQHNLPPLDLSGPSVNRITVRTRADGRRAMVELLVADSGPTLSDDARSHLFEPFAQRRASAPAGMTAALGMGLAVSYEIIRRLGGDMEARAGKDGGNELLVRLPQFQPPAPTPPT